MEPTTRHRSGLGGALAMVFVGGSVAVSGHLAHAPLFTAQAIRYAVASVILLLLARAGRQAIRRPRGAEWLWLLGVAGAGLVLFNIALVRGSEHAEPAVLGVAVACVPVVMATIGPMLEGGSPTRAAVAAAGVVTLGAVLVEGLGHADTIGLIWAVIVFACEAGFTLLAMPVLGRHGAFGVSVHATWLAALAFAIIGIAHEGPAATLAFDRGELLAIGYLAVLVTAAAFVLWYGAVAGIGAARAGLLTGIAPVAAALTGVALGAPMPGLGVWVGVAVVGAGLALGMRGTQRALTVSALPGELVCEGTASR